MRNRGEIQPVPDYEASDFSTRPVTLFVLGVFPGIFLILGLLKLFVVAVSGDSTAAVSGIRSNAPPLSNVLIERLEAEKEARGRLHSYQWRNRQAGVVQLPLKRAQDLMLEELRRAHPDREPRARKSYEFDLNRLEGGEP